MQINNGVLTSGSFIKGWIYTRSLVYVRSNSVFKLFITMLAGIGNECTCAGNKIWKRYAERAVAPRIQNQCYAQ